MALDTISIGLDFKQEKLRAELAQLIAGQEGFRLTPIADHQFPDLVILEMDEDRVKTFAQLQDILATSPSTEIFLTAPNTDPEVLLEALRAGVKEFIPQPIKRAELEEALTRVKERSRTRKPTMTKRGKVINVIGSKGGVGTTTIAVNLATNLLHANDDKSVVLVDLNAQFGDAALYLDLEPAHTFADIAKNLPRLDETFLRSVLTRHDSGIFLLPSPSTIEGLGVLTPDSVQRTIDLLQTLFDYIVIDSGHTLDEITVVALNKSPTIFLVSGLTLPILRNTRKVLDIFASLGFSPGTINIIVNRYTKKSDVTLKDVEDVLKQKPFCTIPNDYFTTMSAINNGKPIANIASRAEVTKSLSRLAFTVVMEGTEEINTSFLRRFFKSK